MENQSIAISKMENWALHVLMVYFFEVLGQKGTAMRGLLFFFFFLNQFGATTEMPEEFKDAVYNHQD